MKIRMSPFDDRMLYVDGFHTSSREAALKVLEEIRQAIDIMWPLPIKTPPASQEPKKT